MARRLLLTGMSGTGKSSAIQRLAALGYKAVDFDEPGWSEYDSDGEWTWREDQVLALLSSLKDDEILFVSGCAINQGKFYPQFDAVILLSAPADVIVERLRTRTNNPYGKHADELAATLDNLATVEPLLRKGADHEIVTTLPLDQVVAEVVKVVEELP
jgi:shikimate kinase